MTAMAYAAVRLVDLAGTPVEDTSCRCAPQSHHGDQLADDLFRYFDFLFSAFYISLEEI
jgi:hypothetical protein